MGGERGHDLVLALTCVMRARVWGVLRSAGPRGEVLKTVGPTKEERDEFRFKRKEEK